MSELLSLLNDGAAKALIISKRADVLRPVLQRFLTQLDEMEAAHDDLNALYVWFHTTDKAHDKKEHLMEMAEVEEVNLAKAYRHWESEVEGLAELLAIPPDDTIANYRSGSADGA